MSASEVCLRCGRTGEPGHELKPCSHSECPVPKRAQKGRTWAVCRFCGFLKWIYDGDCGACRKCAATH